MWGCAVLLSAIGLSLSGCGSSTPSTTSPPKSCGSDATFPSSPALTTATGSVSGTGQMAGASSVDVTGSTSMWFANGNIRQDMTMTISSGGISLSMTQDSVQTCSNGTAEITQYADEGQSQTECRTGNVTAECASLTLWGDDTADATCKDVEDCPSGGGKCTVWSVPLSTTSFHAQIFTKIKMTMLKSANIGNLALASMDSQSVDYYFKEETNDLVAMKQTQTTQGVTVDITISYDTWDTEAQVDPSHFAVPSEWQPCESVPPPASSPVSPTKNSPMILV